MIRDLITGAAAVARSGIVRPVLPRPMLLRLGVRTLLGTPTLASAIMLQSSLQPSRTAIVDAAGALTWAQLGERTNRLANAVLARASSGEKVAFMLRNGREAVECYAGLAAAGLSAVPVNTWSTRDELAHIVRTQQPRLIITAREFAPDVMAEAGGAELWLVGEGGEYEGELAAAVPTPPPARGSGHVVTHTSGTTGKPKGAERDLSSRSLEAFVSFIEKVPLRVDDTFLIAPPLFHTFAQGMMAAGLVLGTTLVLPDRFDPRAMHETIAEQHVTAVALVPVMLRRMLEVDDPPVVATLRIAVLSGSALPSALRQRAEARYGRIVHDLYGSTEVGWATIATPQDQRRKPGSVGTTGRGMTVFAADDSGRVLLPVRSAGSSWRPASRSPATRASTATARRSRARSSSATSATSTTTATCSSRAAPTT
jgi:fatty-acyl-CoA synthase